MSNFADPNEWVGTPHTLTVHSMSEDSFTESFVDLDEYEIDHPSTCTFYEQPIGDGESVKIYTCPVAANEDNGLAYSLSYSGTPIYEPGVYLIQSWGRKIPCHEAFNGYEYDGGVRLVTP